MKFIDNQYTVKHHLFSQFCLHGHFCSDLFLLAAELDFARTMYSVYSWTL